MDIWIKAGQLLLSLSILVVLHELGHFIPAKLFKTRVEKFYLFFNPWFSLFRYKKGDTEYGIGWLPLGGYVKIAGMVDESMDKEQMKKPPEPYEFRAKPAWQRLIIMLGGVTVNLILGIVIYMMILFVYGKEQLPNENVRFGVHPDPVLVEEGFQSGDKIVSINGQEPRYFSEIDKRILVEGARQVTVERNGTSRTLELSPDLDQDLLKHNVKNLFTPRIPFVIDTILPGKPAAASRLTKGDSIVGVNGVHSSFARDLIDEIQSNKGEKVQVHVVRNGEEKTVEVQVGEDGMIGIGPKPPSRYLKSEKVHYGFFESIPAGIDHGINTLTGYVGSLSLVFTKEGAKQVGGFGTIGSLFPDTWDWQRFWNMTALLSIILAFMNILPIPALDGGHVLFLLYEIVSGRPPGQKFMEVAQMAGMVILLALLLYANGMDVFRFFSGS